MSIEADQILDIGDVVRRTGVPTSTLHVWEDRGLIAPVGRSGLRRQYHVGVIRTIGVIVLCQRSGFSLAEIAALLTPGALAGDKQLLVDKLADLQTQRNTLDAAIDGIRHALACEHPSPLECPGFLAHVEQVLPDEQRST